MFDPLNCFDTSFDGYGHGGTLPVDFDLVFEPWPHLPDYLFAGQLQR